MMRNRHGFTLIELMIAVAIVGILASIAYPSYVQYGNRGHCAQGESFLMDIADQEAHFYFNGRVYTDTVGVGGLGLSLPSDVAANFNAPVLAVNNAAIPPTFVVTLTPQAAKPALVAMCTIKVNSLMQQWVDADGNDTYDTGTDHEWK